MTLSVEPKQIFFCKCLICVKWIDFPNVIYEVWDIFADKCATSEIMTRRWVKSQSHPDCASHWGNKHTEAETLWIKSNFSIDGPCFNKSQWCLLVSDRVNSPIQFPPEVELHRQGLEGRGYVMCVCLLRSTLTCTDVFFHVHTYFFIVYKKVIL